MPEKVRTVIAIAEITETTVKEAKRMFRAYKEQDVINDCYFDDDVWHLNDETRGYNFDFSLDNSEYARFKNLTGIEEEKFKEFLKTYVMCKMGELSLTTVRTFIYYVKRSVYADPHNLRSLIQEYNAFLFGYVSEFLSLIAGDDFNRTADYINMLDIAEDFARGSDRGQRSLAVMESYFVFDEIIKDFWKTTTNIEEKLFYFPVWLWWNLSGVLPLRPCEFVLIPRDCIKRTAGKYTLTVRRNKIKGSGRTKSYKISSDYQLVSYTIPEDLAKQIVWYQKKTKDFPEANTHTLFVADTHYARWERLVPVNSRYFSYINLRTCLRYFFEQIIRDRYGYTIIYENENQSHLDDNTIEYLHLGDTRHLALINMIYEGSTPMVAMLLAGHENPEMSAHYYSNISTLIECRTYRQYKKMIKGKQNYTISGPHQIMNVHVRTKLEKGWCLSEKVAQGDFTDCKNVVGPAGEIGFCQNCRFYKDESMKFADRKEMYKNEIEMECRDLERIVNMVRAGKGHQEEILGSIMRLQNKEYSYQQYLLSKLGEEDDA